MSQAAIQIRFCNYFYMIEACALRDNLKWQDITRFVVTALFDDYNYFTLRFSAITVETSTLTINHIGY